MGKLTVNPRCKCTSSGTFGDISERGMGARVNEFSDNPWYDRGGQYGWAIDGRQSTAPLIHQTAASIGLTSI